MGRRTGRGNQFDCTRCYPLYLAAEKRSHAEALRRKERGTLIFAIFALLRETD